MLLRTVATASAVLVAAGVALYFAIRLAVFGELNPHRLDRTSVPRIRISAEAFVSGQPVSGVWTVPAIKHWAPPKGWLSGGSGSFRTVRSPFDTVFLRLPTGGGVGIDLRQALLDMTWRWRPVTSPIERSRTLYYLLDSLDRPRVADRLRHCSPRQLRVSQGRFHTQMQSFFDYEFCWSRPFRNSVGCRRQRPACRPP